MHPQLWFSGRPDSSQQCSVNIYDRFVDSYPCEYWCWHPEAIINKGLYVKRIPVSWQFQPECHPNVEMSNRVASSSVYWTHWRYREWTAIYRCFTHRTWYHSLSGLLTARFILHLRQWEGKHSARSIELSTNLQFTSVMDTIDTYLGEFGDDPLQRVLEDPSYSFDWNKKEDWRDIAPTCNFSLGFFMWEQVCTC